MNNTILITGATSGIGEASAKLFSSQGYRVIIAGRRNDRLKALARLLTKEYNSEVLPLCFDVCNRQAVDASIDSISPDWKQINILLNNAGLSQGLEPIHTCDIEDWERMIDTNMKGLLYVTRKIAPIMVARGSGHIINIGSIAGKEVYPNGNVYCATKFAVEALTQAMRKDLLEHGIKVTQVAPGAVKTEFSAVRFHGDLQRAEGVYKGFDPLKAEDIAEVIFFVATRPPNVNINDIIVMPTAQASTTQIFRRPE